MTAANPFTRFDALTTAQQRLLAGGLVFTLALVTRFAWFGYPQASMIDEVYFGRYLSSYFTGQYYFDTHPPLGKLMIAAFAACFDFQPIAWNTEWTTVLPAKSYFILRGLPSIFGVIFPLLIWHLTEKLFGNARLAVFVALLVVFDNALMTQSRFLFYDIFLLTFGFGAVLAFLYYREKPCFLTLLGCALLAGAAGAVKWNGISFALIPIALAFVDCCLKRTSLLRFATITGVIAAGALWVYVTVFAAHLALLPKSGTGDAYMTPAFQSQLEGSRFQGLFPQRQSFLHTFKELNIEMYRANQRMGNHPFGSRWYQWPVAQGMIGYWQHDNQEISLQANSAVWLTGTAGLLLLGVMTLVKLQRLAEPAVVLILAGYFSNWLPFIMIKRVMFLHSYFPALIFSMLALGWAIHRLPLLRRYYGWLLLPVIGYFAYLLPTSYGL